MTSICPICGKKRKAHESLVAAFGCTQHRCNARFLKYSDATMDVQEREQREPSEGERLELGFRMLDGYPINF